MKTYRELYEALVAKPIAAQPLVAKPMMTQYNPVYNYNQQQFNPNRGSSPLPRQDPTMAKIQGGTATVAKILDPSGVLSWEDIPPAVDAYNKQPTPGNAFLMLLAFTAAIPLLGKISSPLKAAVKSGNYAKTIQLTPYISKKIAQLVEQNMGNIAKLNIPQETIQNALQMVKTAKAEEMIPLSILKQSIKDFKQAGGWLERGEESFQRTQPWGDKIEIQKGINNASQDWWHEFGHHLASKSNKNTPSLHNIQDTRGIVDGRQLGNMADLKKSKNFIDRSVLINMEREANQHAINYLRSSGASEKQINNFKNTMLPYFRTYTQGEWRDLDNLSKHMINISNSLGKKYSPEFFKSVLQNSHLRANTKLYEYFLDQTIKKYSGLKAKYVERGANDVYGQFRNSVEGARLYKKIFDNDMMVRNGGAFADIYKKALQNSPLKQLSPGVVS